MTRHFDGPFRMMDGGGESRDGDDPFPLQETVTDFAGRRREFEISSHETPLGFSMCAREIGKEEGYEFWGFDGTSPASALWKVRGKLQRALSTRHLRPEDGELIPTHDVLRGRITSNPESGEAAFVVDGELLSLAELGRIAAIYEGFEFLLKFRDKGE